MTAYTYIDSTEFISNLAFDHVETYSFQRGAEFEEKRFLESNGLLGFTQYLLNDKGQFHPSSRKTNHFKFNDPNIDRIKSILLTEIVEIPRWLCAPVYRDAIVFYDKSNKIISSLNICLSCKYMETKMFNHVNGDYKTYDLLKRFFIDIGHDVEDAD